MSSGNRREMMSNPSYKVLQCFEYLKCILRTFERAFKIRHTVTLWFRRAHETVAVVQLCLLGLHQSLEGFRKRGASVDLSYLR